ncbi:hypothetical protein CK203_023927 [Vitis vinifera]|uniref:Uncharacterized protein n=1 Tax=Vitis vinifera TaxID=29760 RepID=A0A438JAA9_VITVI|nr:hypothetical protein CK203_023927 [Vitis vinifera]
MNSGPVSRPKEANGGVVSGPTYLKERDGGRICHSEEGVGDGISKVGGQDLLLRLSLLHEEE